MTEQVTIFEPTGENFYEILWNARLQYFIQNFSTEENVQDVLTKFRRADLCYYWEAHTVTLQKTEEDPIREYYTGGVTLTPLDPELAKNQYLVAEQSSKRQSATILKHINEDIDAVVELGAGYGGNFIRLDRASLEETGKSLSERNIKLFMAEYTNTGRNLCSEFLKCKKAPEMEISHVDHKALDLSFLKGVERPLIITVHSVEQITQLPADYFKILSQAAPSVQGLHLEPVGFQFEPDNPKWEEHAKVMKDKNWNKNFADVIRQAEKDGYISIDKIDTNFTLGQPGNPTTLVTWHSNN